MFKPCCYTAGNSYKIYRWKPNDEKYDVTNGEVGKRLMKLKEQSDLCPTRCLVPASCRGYSGNFIAEVNRKILFTMQKPAKCSFLCFKRPTATCSVLNEDQDTGVQLEDRDSQITRIAEMRLTENGKYKLIDKEDIGWVELPFGMLTFTCNIFNHEGEMIFKIKSSKLSCQNIFCPTPLGACNEMTFTMYFANSSVKEPIGYIYKKWSTFQEQCLSTAAHYILQFPEGMNWKNKLLILTAL